MNNQQQLCRSGHRYGGIQDKWRRYSKNLGIGSKDVVDH